MSITMYELEAILEANLRALRVEYRKEYLIKDISVQFVVEKFGVIVCGINRMDYKLVDTAVGDQYEGWRIVYITTYDDMNEKRDEVLWAMMKSGYLMWLRHHLTTTQYRKLMFDSNIAHKVINKRLTMWEDDPKYRYLKECDAFAAGQGRISEYLAKEPGFFDYMPEIGD
jgi:hypothetical protein